MRNLRKVLVAVVAVAVCATIVAAAGGIPGPSKSAERIGFPGVSSAGPLKATQANKLISPGAQAVWWGLHPDQAPPRFRARLEAARAMIEKRSSSGRPTAKSVEFQAPQLAAVLFDKRFNLEAETPVDPGAGYAIKGLPQNEEAVAECPSATGGAQLLGGTNDYRGFFDDRGVTGWHYSTNGGANVLKEGRLPPITVAGNVAPSRGDPAAAAIGTGSTCSFYMASLNFETASGIGVYKTTAATLATCTTDETCWPTSRPAAEYADGNTFFADKEWLEVGPNGTGGTRVAITYTLFTSLPDGDFTSNVYLVLCDGNLTTCTAPAPLDTDVAYFATSGDFLQLSYVDVRSNGDVYANWTHFDYVGASPTNPSGYNINIRGRVWKSGTGLGPTRNVITDTQWLPWGNWTMTDLPPRVSSHAKGGVAPSGRWWIVWDRCAVPADEWWACPNVDLYARYSDNEGATWTTVGVAAGVPHQFMPTQPEFNPTTGTMVIGYYSTGSGRAHDFDSQYEVYMTYSPSTGPPAFNHIRAGGRPTEPLSDWWALDPYFIGDYFEVVARGTNAYIHHNAEYTRQPILGIGHPQHQADNYISNVQYP